MATTGERLHKVDLKERAAQVARVWWWFVFVGVLSLIAGIILITKPSNSLATLAVVAGIFLLVDGAGELIRAVRADEDRALSAIIGVLGIVIGIGLIRHPFHGVAAIGLLIGIWLVASGIVRLVRGAGAGRHRVLQLIIALLELFVGIAMVSDPSISYATLAVLAGAWFIVNGVTLITFGLVVRHFKSKLVAAGDGAG